MQIVLVQKRPVAGPQFGRRVPRHGQAGPSVGDDGACGLGVAPRHMRVGQRQRAGARPWRLSSEIGDHAIRVAVARHRRFALRPHVGQARPVRVAVQEIDIIVERGPAAPEPGPFDDVARHRIVEFRDSLGRECVVPRAQCDKRETERIGVGARGQGLQNRQQKEANRKQRTAHPDPPVRAVISQDIGRPRHRNSRTWQFRRRGVGSAPVFAKPRKTIQRCSKDRCPRSSRPSRKVPWISAP